MSQAMLFDKIYGAILGSAIGDAMGSAVESIHYKDIEERYGKVTGFKKQLDRYPNVFPENRPFYEVWGSLSGPEFRGRTRPWGPYKDMAGAYTDDQRLQLLYYQAIARKGGRITGKDMAQELLEYRQTFLGVSKNPTFHWDGGDLERLMLDTHRWFDPFLVYPSPSAFIFSGCDAPAGVINAFDPDRAADDGFVVAAAVAEAMKPAATVDSIIQAVLSHAERMGRAARELTARVGLLLDIAKSCPDVYALRQPFYDRFLVPSAAGVYWLEAVPCVLAMLHIAKGDPAQTIIGCVNMGRDSDTIAAIAGALVGAFKGSRGLPVEWVSQVIEANPEVDMYKLAQEVHSAVVNVIESRAKVAACASAVV